ncbi:MAG: hypothetical protein ACYTF7_06440, partial [Planctomycetota bacterium]
MRILKGLAALVFSSALTVTGHAAVAFDNYDPTAPDLGNFGSVGTWHYYQTFTPTQSGYVTSVDLKGISQISDQGPLRINIRNSALGASLEFVDVPYASVPATEGSISANFSGSGAYLVAGVQYVFGVELTVAPGAAPTGYRLELASDHLTVNEDLVIVNNTGISGTFPDLFFEIRVHVDPPVDPTGYAADSGLRVWERKGAVYDVDGPTATASNETPMTTPEIVPGFEYADGVYYASTRITPTNLLNLDPVSGALNS